MKNQISWWQTDKNSLLVLNGNVNWTAELNLWTLENGRDCNYWLLTDWHVTQTHSLLLLSSAVDNGCKSFGCYECVITRTAKLMVICWWYWIWIHGCYVVQLEWFLTTGCWYLIFWACPANWLYISDSQSSMFVDVKDRTINDGISFLLWLILW